MTGVESRGGALPVAGGGDLSTPVAVDAGGADRTGGPRRGRSVDPAATDRIPADDAYLRLLADDVRDTDDDRGLAVGNVRRCAARLERVRERLREIRPRIREALREAAEAQRLADRFGIAGLVLGALGSLAALLTTCGVALPGGIGLLLALGSGSAGIGKAMKEMEAQLDEAEAMEDEAEAAAQECDAAGTEASEQRAFDQLHALSEIETGLRAQALRWLQEEDAGRRLAAGAAALR
jgi:hypothetical protein